MYLAEQVYMLIRQQLFNAGITAYSDYVPQETSYPFVMYQIVGLGTNPIDWGFSTDFETLTVKFNVYDDDANPSEVVTIMAEIEALFNLTHLGFPAMPDSEGKLICVKKTDENLVMLTGDEYYWQGSSFYDFMCQRVQGDTLISSSSSSSISSESSESSSSSSSLDSSSSSSLDSSSSSSSSTGE